MTAGEFTGFRPAAFSFLRSLRRHNDREWFERNRPTYETELDRGFAAFDLNAYLPIGILILMAIIFVVVNLIGTHLLGPSRHGEQKDTAYESGMNPIGSARKRFNVRFYILAMTFLVFDVEIIFLYPWALTFTKLVPQGPEATLFLGRIMFFIATSIVAYIYAWRKGVFRWD